MEPGKGSGLYVLRIKNTSAAVNPCSPRFLGDLGCFGEECLQLAQKDMSSATDRFPALSKLESFASVCPLAGSLSHDTLSAKLILARLQHF